MNNNFYTKPFSSETLLEYQEDSRRIKFEIMAGLGLKLNPFSQSEIELLDKVEKGEADREEIEEANCIYRQHEQESITLSDKVEAYLSQCNRGDNNMILMLH